MKETIPLFKVFMAPTAKEKVGEVLDSGYIGQGTKVDEFEKQLGEYFGNEKVVTTNAGTSALHLALHLLKKPKPHWREEFFGVAFVEHNWPGNVFEVMNLAQNIINNMVSAPEIIKINEIKEILDNSTGNSHLYDMNYKEAKEKFEREFLIQKLKNNNWNMTLTSKILNLDRVSLYRKIKSLNIKID